MKKIFTLIFCLVSLGASAQFQIPNSDFERWDTETYKNNTGDAPVAWNSFLQGSGGLQDAAAANQLSKSEEKRPGSNGSYSAKIVDRYIDYKIVKAYAQGNLTTGCINMGSATANNPGKSATDNNSKRGKESIFSGSGNYNWTNIDDTTYNAKFTGFPDAMHVWIKYYSPTTSYRAKATTVLHTNGYYQDPLPKTDDCEGDLVGTAANTNIAPDANNWQELTIPFSYPNGTTTRPSFALVTFSTNATPGTGTGSDYMLIDDLEYIYYSTLSNLKYDNTNIENLTSEIVGLGSNEVSYTLYDKSFSEDLITFDIDGKGATVKKEWDKTNKTYTITVKGDDWSESKNQHVYKIHFVNNSVLTDVKFNNTTISGFNKETMAYTIDDAYTEGCITYTKDGEKATVEESWDAATKTYTIIVKGVDHSDTPDNIYTFDNKHTYTITFTCDAVIEDGVTDIATMEDVSKGTILLKRTFKAGWNTICLPFPSSITLLGDGVKAYTLQSVNTNGGLVFSSASTFIKNTPYLVYFPNEVKNVKFTSKTINETRTAGSKVAGDWTFTGTYVPSISMEGKWGVVNEGGKVRKGGAGSTMKGTRAYLTYNGSASINEMRFIIDGEETNITEIDGEPLSYDVYNLNGMLVRKNATDLNGLRKGIYIVNGKKYIVK